MADLARIKRNVAKMASMNAPESDIDGYIASEGVTVDDVRNYKAPPLMPLSEAQRAKPKGNIMDGVLWEALKGFGGGIESGMDRITNAATFGGYDWANRKYLGDMYAKKQAKNQAQAEAAGVGGLNKAANLVAEIGGGGATTGNAAYNLAGKIGLKNLGRLAAAGGLEGAAWGATGSDTLVDALINIPASGLTGAVLGTALGAGGEFFKKFSPKLITAGKKTGLTNALSDDDSVKILKRGIQASDDVANQIKQDAPEVLGKTNEKMSEELDRLTGRKLDINQSLKNQRRRYNDFISQNAGRELFNAAPTRGQLSNYPAQSKFNLPKSKLSPEEAGELLKDRAAKNNIEIDGTIGHYVNKRDRGQYTRTLSNTLNNPDIVFSLGNKGYVVKKYDTNGKPFFDFITKKDGKLYDKFNTDANYVDNQLKKTVQNVSLSGNVIESNAGPTHSLPSITGNSLPLRQIVVNGKLPNLDDYTIGLSKYQRDALSEAITKGGELSTDKVGSLGATHRASEVLDQMIKDSRDKSVLIGPPKDTPYTVQLYDVKDRINQIMAPSGIKPYDKSLSKAKSLEEFYEKGYKFKPSEVKFERLGFKSDRDRRAFLQGRIAKILDDVKETKSVAKSIQNDYNVLEKLMPERQFKSLKKVVSENETVFERMSDLRNRAKNQVVKPAPAERPMSERTETKGSIYGSIADKLNKLLYGYSNRKAAQHLLNGLPTKESALLEALARANPAFVGNYINEEFVRNK